MELTGRHYNNRKCETTPPCRSSSRRRGCECSFMIIKRAVLAFCLIILLSRFVDELDLISLDLNFQRVVTKIRRLISKGWSNFENDNLHEDKL